MSKNKKNCSTCFFNCDFHCNDGTYLAQQGKNGICYEGELWQQNIDFYDMWDLLPKDIRTACENCEQSKIHHPEGSVFNHIKLVFEYAKRNYADLDLMLCAIFHDLGKPETQVVTELENGEKKITNYGHETLAKKYIDEYFYLYEHLNVNKEKIIEVCENHMRAHQYENGKLKNPNKIKAFESLKYFDDIMKFSECDDKGRGF